MLAEGKVDAKIAQLLWIKVKSDKKEYNLLFGKMSIYNRNRVYEKVLAGIKVG